VMKRTLRGASRRGTTVFLTTHQLGTVHDLIDHYGMIRNGELVAQGEVAALSREGLTIEDTYLKEFGCPDHEELKWLG